MTAAVLAPRPVHVVEADVSKQICDYLKVRRWRLIRNNVGGFQGQSRWVPIGEPGMPDWLALYYLPRGICAHIWIELKKPKNRTRRGKAAENQETWHRNEQLRGALIVTVDNLTLFAEWYEREFWWIHEVEYIKGQKVIGWDLPAAGKRAPAEELVAAIIQFSKSGKGVAS